MTEESWDLHSPPFCASNPNILTYTRNGLVAGHTYKVN